MLKNLSDEIVGALYIAISALMYATLPILVKYAYAAGLSPGSTLLLRYFFAFLFLSGYLLLTKSGPIFSRSPWVIAQGILMIAGGLFYFFSLQNLPAGLASVIFFTHPIMVAILALVVFKEKLMPRLIAGLVLALVGISLISGLGQGMVNISPRGLTFCILSALTYASYCLIGQKNVARVSPLSLTATIALVAIVILTIIYYHDLAFIMTLNARQLIIGISMAFFNTVLSIIFFLKGIQKIGASRAALISTLEPMLTILIAFALLGEILTAPQIIGSLLVIISMLLAI